MAFLSALFFSICLVVYPKGKDIDAAVEVYTFNFLYKDQDIAISLNQMNITNGSNKSFDFDELNTKNWKSSVTETLSTIKSSGICLKPLPNNLMLTMKIEFIDGAPEDFEISGFRACELDRKIKFENKNSKIRPGGSINTVDLIIIPFLFCLQKFHVLKVTMQTEASLVHNESIRASQTQSQISCADIDSVVSSLSEELSGRVISCLCGSNKDNLMITCINCGSDQHGPCCNVFNHNLFSYRHLCFECSNEDPSAHLDQDLKKAHSKEDRKIICLLRRSLYLVHLMSIDKLTTQTLRQELAITFSEARDLMKNLKDLGLLHDGNKVDYDSLRKDLIPKYLMFSVNDEDLPIITPARKHGSPICINETSFKRIRKSFEAQTPQFSEVI